MKSLLLSLLLLVVSPAFAQDATCVTDYDPAVDYFPDKAELTDAQDFSVEYFNHYKVVTVTDAFTDAPDFHYVLVQCGTPAPDAADFPDGTQFIEIPVRRFVAMTTTLIPHLAEIDQLDTLVGMDSLTYVNNPQVRAMIDARQVVEVGMGANVNVEQVLAAEPDVVVTFGYSPDNDAHPLLIDAGVSTALNAEWREATPLGRAEWIKYTALFFNAEARAQEVYAEIATAYETARALAASVPDEARPAVLWNTFSSFTDAWTIPGAQTYAGALIHDAGGVVALGEEAPDANALIDFETVYAGALDADVWIANSSSASTLDDLLALDSRYADFAAVQHGNVWNNNRDVGSTGGNNYWEVGVTHPHLILQDLVAIFHPDLLPDHEFAFYHRLEAGQ